MYIVGTIEIPKINKFGWAKFIISIHVTASFCFSIHYWKEENKYNTTQEWGVYNLSGFYNTTASLQFLHLACLKSIHLVVSGLENCCMWHVSHCRRQIRVFNWLLVFDTLVRTRDVLLLLFFCSRQIIRIANGMFLRALLSQTFIQTAHVAEQMWDTHTMSWSFYSRSTDDMLWKVTVRKWGTSVYLSQI